MSGEVFVAFTSDDMAREIEAAQRRVVCAAPGIHENVAAAIVSAIPKIGQEHIEVILDCDEKVFRLGYGDIKAVRVLTDNGLIVRQEAGLRLGILICDDKAWCYSPVALLIETEHKSDGSPNAVYLSVEEAERLVRRLSPESRKEAIAQAETEEEKTEAEQVRIEIGVPLVSEEKLKEIETSLVQAPPIPFDVSRQVMVYQPYIQYVEINLRGCSIQKKTIEVPKSIVDIASEKEIKDRLRTTFNLIEKSSELSSGQLDEKVKRLRDLYAKSLGREWGRVLLKSKKALFDDQVAMIRNDISEHQKKIKEQLSKELIDSKQKLIEYYTPLLQERPPEKLTAQITESKPSDQQIRDWLNAELDECVPSPEDLISDMKLECVFKDVTIETLRQKGFLEALKKAFPHVNWNKPFEEFQAAKEDTAGNSGAQYSIN